VCSERSGLLVKRPVAEDVWATVEGAAINGTAAGCLTTGRTTRPRTGCRLAVGSAGGLSYALWHLDRLLSRRGEQPVTEDNLAFDVRGSPGKTAVRMALT
jgi:hypothetical protein